MLLNKYVELSLDALLAEVFTAEEIKKFGDLNALVNDVKDFITAVAAYRRRKDKDADFEDSAETSASTSPTKESQVAYDFPPPVASQVSWKHSSFSYFTILNSYF